MTEKKLIDQELADRIYRFLFKCFKNQHKPDLHSFIIHTVQGKAFVECRNQEVYIAVGDDQWIGNIVAGANRLALMGADLKTVDM